MKTIKKLSIFFACVLCLVLCFAFAGCNKASEQLQNEQGALLEGGGFEEGSTLVTDLIETTGEKGQEIISLLEEQNYDKDGEMKIYDIFVAKDGKEVQPSGKVKVTLPAPFESENGYVTFHVKDDDSVETLETTYAEGKISFETDSFSYFVLAEAEKYYTLGVINVGGRGTVGVDGVETSEESDLSFARTEGSESVLVAKETLEGYAFIGWYGSADLSNVWDIKYDHLLSAEKTYTFTMPASDYIIYAVFKPVQDYYTLGVINVGGRGTVSVDGVETSEESDLSFARTEGSEAVLVAKETLEGYAFIGWYGTMDTSNVWALKYDTLLSTEKTFTFTMPPYDYIIYAVLKPVHTVYAHADKDTEGTIRWGENNESTAAEVRVAEGKSVALTAVPKQGYTFLGWYDEPKNENEQIGNLLCQDATYTINVEDMDVNIYARFEKIPEPVPEEYPLTVGQMGAGGSISINGDTASSFESNPYYENYEAGERITLVAQTRSSDYAFLGWYEIDDTILTHLVLKDTPVSTELTYTFDMPKNAYTVYAVFEAKVTGLILDGANAGFSEGKATYTIGDENKPNPENVSVSGVTASGNVPLTKDVDYTIDLGGLDFAKVGTYTITYTYLKDNTIKETLTVEVTEPKYMFSAYVSGGSGAIYFGNVEQPNGYQAELTAGAEVTLTAVASEGYTFLGWYEPDVTEVTTLVLKDTPVSTDATHTFTVTGQYSVYAVFEAKVTGLVLDGANAGFDMSAEKTVVYIGAETTPNPEAVLVSAVKVTGNTPLTRDTDYTIDLGGLDFDIEGTYTITYTYLKDTTLYATLQISVEVKKYNFNAYVYQDSIGLGTIAFAEYYCESGETNEAGTHCYYRTTAWDKLGVVATPLEGYEVRWYKTDESGALKELPEYISGGYFPAMPESDLTIYVVFTKKIVSLRLDAANAGFTGGTATYQIGADSAPDAEAVLVYGKDADGNETLLRRAWQNELGDLQYEYSILYNDGTNNYSRDYVLTHAGTYTVYFIYYSDEYNSTTGTWGFAATLTLTVVSAS